jgi:hypothetical protein
MVSLKDFMEVVNYRITEGSDYCWECYGNNAYCLDSWNGEQDGHSLSIIFDNNTQEVYEVQAHDYRNNRAYRLINPKYKKSHDDEASSRGLEKDEAWDDLKYVDLEVEDDFLEKARAIVLEEGYDTRVKVPLNLPDDSLFDLMKMAHEQDITLNQLVERALREAIDQFEANEMRDEYDFSEAVRGAPMKMASKKSKKKKKHD